MNTSTAEALQTYFRRIEDICPQLFAMAHAICGNYELAEYALRSALLRTWSESSGSGMGLREKQRNTLCREALRIALSPQGRTAEITWNGLREENSGESILLRLISSENPELRRLLALHYGCGLSLYRTARVMEIPFQRAREMLIRFQARLRRRLPPGQRNHEESLMSREIRRIMSVPDQACPDSNNIFRAFQAEAGELEHSDHRYTRILGRGIMVLLALLCALIFWLFAVVSQSPSSGETNVSVVRENIP